MSVSPRKTFHEALDTRQAQTVSGTGYSAAAPRPVTLVREPWERRIDRQSGNTSRAIVERRKAVHAALAGGE